MENLKTILEQHPEFFKTVDLLNSKIEEIETQLTTAYPFTFYSCMGMGLAKVGDKKRWCSNGKPVADCSVYEKVCCIAELDKFTLLLRQTFQTLKKEVEEAVQIADTWIKQPKGTMVVKMSKPFPEVSEDDAAAIKQHFDSIVRKSVKLPQQ